MSDNSRNRTPFIQGIALSKVYGQGSQKIEVLNNLDIVIHRFERVAIVGASGAGKSTLLHILGTLDRPTAGKVFYQDKDVFLMKDEDLARFRNRHIGFVFQFHYLMPEFNALENVMMPGIIAGEPLATVRNRAVELLTLLGLEKRLHHKIGELSGGEQQRVAIARALLMKPKVLLADEPTGNLDGKTSTQIHHMLVQLNEEFGLTMVIVTHNMELASMMHRALKLRDGRLIPLNPA